MAAILILKCIQGAGVGDYSSILEILRKNRGLWTVYEFCYKSIFRDFWTNGLLAAVSENCLSPDLQMLWCNDSRVISRVYSIVLILEFSQTTSPYISDQHFAEREDLNSFRITNQSYWNLDHADYVQDRVSVHMIASLVDAVNPLGPNIQAQILQTGLHTFPQRISWENVIKDKGIFSMVIILLIFITLSLDNIWILSGENWCWSLLGLTGLISFCRPPATQCVWEGESTQPILASIVVLSLGVYKPINQ